MSEQTSLDKTLQRLFEDDNNAIWRQQEKLKEIHQNLPSLIEKTSQLMDIDAEQLVVLAKQTTFRHSSLEWYDVISVLNTFYVNKKREEKSEKQ